MSNLKRIRMENNLTQAQLAELTGINKSIIQKYEQKQRDINGAHASTIYRLSKALFCSMEEIIEVDEIKDVIEI